MHAALANHWHLHIIEDLIEMNGNNMYSNKLYTVHAPLKATVFIFFTPFFTAVNITEKLCTKQGNYSIKSTVYESGFKSRVGYNGYNQFCLVHLHIIWDYCMNLHVGMHEGHRTPDQTNK